MKIAVWILSDYKQQIGGGFALYDKFIQLIDSWNFSNGLDVCFVGYNSPSYYSFRKKYIQLQFSGLGFLDKSLARISHKVSFLNQHQQSILLSNAVDMVYYPIQGFRKIPNFPFVVSNWDIGHKASYAFPELGMNYSFDYRDKWYTKGIFKALAVFAESQTGKEELMYFTRLNPDRIKIVPLFPGGVVDVKAEEEVQLAKLKELRLNSQRYFFYPAQFWAHKNHYNLLQAFAIFAKENKDIQLVLTGSDKGNKTYIKEVVKTLGLNERVVFPGFIDNEAMLAVYRHASGLVMPSFLGPTNMPQLEARMLGCPVLCSDLPGHKEMLGEGALYFDPADPMEISRMLKKVLEPSERASLLSKAAISLSTTSFTAENALRQLDHHFQSLIPIRMSWGNSDKIF